MLLQQAQKKNDGRQQKMTILKDKKSPVCVLNLLALLGQVPSFTVLSATALIFSGIRGVFREIESPGGRDGTRAEEPATARMPRNGRSH